MNQYLLFLSNKDIHVDPSYHHSINKAITLDNERNKENLYNESVNRSYLTLQKFSDHNPNNIINETQSNLSFSASRPDQTNSLMNKNVFSIHDDTADDLLQQSSKMSAHSSRNASRTSLSATNNNTKSKNLFDTYENQIIKNIQSIRRNSNSSSGSSGGAHGNTKTNEAMAGRRRGSSSGQSEHASAAAGGGGGSRRGSLNNITPKRTSPSNVNQNDNDDDDDDDDIFSGSSQLVKPVATSLHGKASSLTNLKSNNNSHLEKQTNLDYTDDISFNDDYGETEENNLKKKNISTKSKTNVAPKPVPRSKYAQNGDEDDSDQNYDLDDDYGGGEDDDEEEDDDKF